MDQHEMDDDDNWVPQQQAQHYLPAIAEHPDTAGIAADGTITPQDAQNYSPPPSDPPGWAVPQIRQVEWWVYQQQIKQEEKLGIAARRRPTPPSTESSNESRSQHQPHSHQKQQPNAKNHSYDAYLKARKRQRGKKKYDDDDDDDASVSSWLPPTTPTGQQFQPDGKAAGFRTRESQEIFESSIPKRSWSMDDENGDGNDDDDDDDDDDNNKDQLNASMNSWVMPLPNGRTSALSKHEKDESGQVEKEEEVIEEFDDEFEEVIEEEDEEEEIIVEEDVEEETIEEIIEEEVEVDEETMSDEGEESRCISKFSEGQDVQYKRGELVQKATVVKVHLDDDLEPYYTIRLAESGREKQTDELHLEEWVPTPKPSFASLSSSISSKTDRTPSSFLPPNHHRHRRKYPPNIQMENVLNDAKETKSQSKQKQAKQIVKESKQRDAPQIVEESAPEEQESTISSTRTSEKYKDLTSFGSRKQSSASKANNHGKSYTASSSSSEKESSMEESGSTQILYIRDPRDLEEVVQKCFDGNVRIEDADPRVMANQSDDDNGFVPSEKLLLTLACLILVVAFAIGVGLYFFFTKEE